MNKIGIIGAGAWGTASAMAVQRAGRDVVIQAHETDVVEAINSNHENPVFLPGVTLDPRIRATPDLAEAADADLVLVVVPAQHLRPICEKMAAWKILLHSVSIICRQFRKNTTTKQQSTQAV